MDPWIHGSAAGAAARPAAGAAAGTATSAATACIYYVIIGGALRAPLYVHGEIHTAEAAVEAAAPELATSRACHIDTPSKKLLELLPLTLVPPKSC